MLNALGMIRGERIIDPDKIEAQTNLSIEIIPDTANSIVLIGQLDVGLCSAYLVCKQGQLLIQSLPVVVLFGLLYGFVSPSVICAFVIIIPIELPHMPLPLLHADAHWHLGLNRRVYDHGNGADLHAHQGGRRPHDKYRDDYFS